MTPGRVAAEQDPPDPDSVAAFRLVGERACLDLATRGVRAVVLRLAPTVHGPRDHGFVPVFVAAARRHGVVAHPGDGENRWPAVHRLDAARLYRRALETAPAGSVLHGVGEEAVRIGDLAAEVGRGLGLPTVPLGSDEFAEHLGSPFLGRVFALDVPASSRATQDLLGWAPREPGLLADLADGDYFEPEAAVRTGNHWSPAG
jgi:nucleoside-diphosphate-sugar epimerase